MGLEMVEIAMEVERTFGITLPDSRTPQITTVGELCEYIVEALGRESEGEGLKGEVFREVETALQSALPGLLYPKEFSKDTTLADLFPPMSRRRARQRLMNSLGMNLPALNRPRWISTLVIVAAVVLGPVTGLLTLFSVFPSKSTSPNWVIGLLCPVFVYGSACLWWFACRALTVPFAVFWPKEICTIGDLSEFVLMKSYGGVARKAKRFSREEVWNILQLIVASTLDLSRFDVQPESRFIEDLGAG